MAHDSLGEFIQAADAVGEARFVDGADLDLEVGCLTELVGEQAGPLLLFDHFAGYPSGYRISANTIRTPRRFALAMGFPIDSHPIDLVKLWRDKRKVMDQPVPPRVVSDGPVYECVEDGNNVDLSMFPAPRWHGEDGGRYIGTGDMVVTRDPEMGWVNFGTY